MKRVFVIAGSLLFLDQLTKFWAERCLSLFSSRPVFGSLLSLPLVHNYGAAYGIFQYQRPLLIAVGVVTVGALLMYMMRYTRSGLVRVGLAILLAGAMGNLLDRIILGYVVDFIDITIFPVFNVADICIDVGIGILILDIFQGDSRRG